VAIAADSMPMKHSERQARECRNMKGRSTFARVRGMSNGLALNCPFVYGRQRIKKNAMCTVFWMSLWASQAVFNPIKHCLNKFTWNSDFLSKGSLNAFQFRQALFRAAQFNLEDAVM
jgi:hypothetical protein